MLKACLLLCVAGRAWAQQPEYEVETLDQEVPGAAGGYFHKMAVDPRDHNRLVTTDGISALWEVNLNSPGEHRTLYAGQTGEGSQGCTDGPRLGAQFDRPRDLCFDLQGNIFLASAHSNVVQRIDGESGMVTVVAGKCYSPGNKDGPAKEALFNAPASLVCLPNGTVLIGDTGSANLRGLNCVANCIPQPDVPHPPDSSRQHWKSAAIALGGVGMVAAGIWGLTYGSNSVCAVVQRRIANVRLRHQGERRSGAESLAALEETVQEPLLPLVETKSNNHSDLISIDDADMITHDEVPVVPFAPVPVEGSGAGQAPFGKEADLV